MDDGLYSNDIFITGQKLDGFRFFVGLVDMLRQGHTHIRTPHFGNIDLLNLVNGRWQTIMQALCYRLILKDTKTADDCLFTGVHNINTCQHVDGKDGKCQNQQRLFGIYMSEGVFQIVHGTAVLY